MLFRSFVAVLSVGLFTQGALAALTLDQVVANVKSITDTSSNANDALGLITTRTTADDVKNAGQQLAASFATIIQSLSADVTAMQTTPPFTDVDAGPVVNALDDFVTVHQLLLSTVIGKHSIFAQFVFTAPIAAALRNLESGVDSFASSLIALIPTRKNSVDTSQKNLDTSIGNSVTTYTAVCVPSTFYPTELPTCFGL